MTSTTDQRGAVPVVRCRAAVFGYQNTPVTRPLNLEIGAGEVVALLGANGSGKSTLVKGLLGLSSVLGGSVELFGTPRGRFREHRRVGYVPQRHTLSGSIRATTREVVSTGLLSARPWWRRASPADHAQVDDALARVDLIDRADTDVATLSGGQQRRALIARALAAGPEVLVMDEPTAGVDAAHQEALAVVLRRLTETGVTMIVVTHELAALRGLVHRIVEMDAGQVAFDGPPDAYAEHRAAQARAAAAHSETTAHDGYHCDEGSTTQTPPLLGPGPLDPTRMRR